MADMQADEVGRSIRTARKVLGLRQADLAALTGLPTSHLSDIERGVVLPTIPTLRRLSAALGRPMGYFFQQEPARPRFMGMVIHRTTIGGQAAARFAQLVEAKTAGEIKLRIYYCAELGTQAEQLEALVEGPIHLYVDEPLCFERYAELCGPVFLPYFFADRGQYHRFLQSSLAGEWIWQKLLDRGIRVLNPASNWECGSFEMLFSTQPLFSPSDLAGRKFRSYPSRAAVGLRNALRAQAVVVEWSQVYHAFRTKQIDAFLAPAAYFLSTQVYEVARYATLLMTGYTLNLTIAISDREYGALPPQVQNILVEAAREAGEYCTALAQERTAIDLERLTQEFGVPVIHPDQQAWRASFSAAIETICTDGLLAPQIYRQIKAL